MTNRNEPEHATNTRTDADSYAEQVMQDMARIVGGLSSRRRGFIRDEIAEAFDEGEHQGTCRALRILGIARRKASSPEVARAIGEILQLLMNEAPDT